MESRLFQPEGEGLEETRERGNEGGREGGRKEGREGGEERETTRIYYMYMYMYCTFVLLDVRCTCTFVRQTLVHVHVCSYRPVHWVTFIFNI